MRTMCYRLYIFYAAIALLCPASQAWAEGENSLAPDTQEEHLTTITLPPEGQPLPADAKQTLDTLSDTWKQEQQPTGPSQPIVLNRGTFPSIDATIQQDKDKPKKMDMRLSKKTGNTLEDLQEKAYYALMAGQSEAAISLYKQALAMQPNNKLALFGLATTYHRNGQVKQARELYAQILKKFPHDRDTLNNFLALIGDTSPRGALRELQQLEAVNPGFSPIPAQMGLLYQRIGDNQKAAEYLKKAVSLSPENLSYRYNLAILLDHLGNKQDAAILYRQLLLAAQDGESIPGDSAAIEERLMFITAPQ